MLAEEFRAAGGWMANVIRIDPQFFELGSSYFPQGHDLLARK